jgi:hypothetical protein
MRVSVALVMPQFLGKWAWPFDDGRVGGGLDVGLGGGGLGDVLLNTNEESELPLA